MATGTIILRPSADIFIGHTLAPLDSTVGYVLINEETTDLSSTFIGARMLSSDFVDDGLIINESSEFELSAIDNIPNEKIIITGVKIHSYGTNGSDSDILSNKIGLCVNGEVCRLHDILYTDFILNDDGTEGIYGYNVVDDIESIQMLNKHLLKTDIGIIPSISIQFITSVGDYNGDPDDKFKYVYCPTLSTIWVELSYETYAGLPIYKKNEHEWKMGYGVYIKSNGSWVKQDIDTAISYINNKFVIDKCMYRGYHIEAPLPDIPATCFSEGMSGGIHCSFCGTILKEHDSTIPMIEHSYDANGVCTVCGAINGGRIKFTISSNYGDIVYYSAGSMTWSEWVDSDYNTNGYYIGTDDKIHITNTDDDYIIDCTSSDLIRANKKYLLTGTIVHYQSLQPLSKSMRFPKFGATTVGNYALFGGDGVVAAYDEVLTASEVEASIICDNGSPELAASTVGNYALFAGGFYKYINSATASVRDGVDAFNISLTRSIPSPLSIGRYNLAGANVGNYALFAGGLDTNLDSVTTVDAYNISLTKSTPTALSKKGDGITPANVGDYALFVGGSSGRDKCTDAYNSSLTRLSPTQPTISTSTLKRYATSANNHAIFMFFNGFIVYDTSLTMTIHPREYTSSGSTVLDNYSLFIGPTTGYVIDEHLTFNLSTNVESSYSDRLGATIGDYAIFAGSSNLDKNYVDAYHILKK